MLKKDKGLSSKEIKVTNKFLEREIPKELKINSKLVNSLFNLNFKDNFNHGISKFRNKK